MLKKLRRKFVLITMGLVGLVLLGVFAAVCTTNYQALRNQVEHALAMAVETKGDGPQKPQVGGERDGRGPKFAPVYAVLLDGEGTVVRSLQSDATMDAQLLRDATAGAFAAEEDEGEFTHLNLYYVRRDSPEGVKVAFADTDNVWHPLRSLLLTSLLVGVCALGAMLLISLFLSRWALRPVVQAWEEQKRFVADASHELKTPLTVILANNDILLSHPQQTVGEQRGWLESTGEEAVHMRRLVEDMLFLAKSDAVQPHLVFSQVDMSELVWSCYLQLEPIAYDRQVQFTSEIEPNIHLEGDAAQLRQLIQILLDNACKYAGEQGRAHITLGREGAQGVLTVQNSGEPIPEEDLAHLFERFYRADKARTGAGGFGLGLAIAQNIVKNHRAALTVKSDSRQGTVFTLRFEEARG